MPKSPAALIGRRDRRRRPDQPRSQEPANDALPETSLSRSSRLPDWRRLLPRWRKPGQAQLIPAESSD